MLCHVGFRLRHNLRTVEKNWIFRGEKQLFKFPNMGLLRFVRHLMQASPPKETTTFNVY